MEEEDDDAHRIDLADGAEADASPPPPRSVSANSIPLPPRLHPPISPLPLTFRPPPLIPGYSRRCGLVCLNLVQDSRAVRSYALFILTLCNFTAVFLASQAVFDLTATCRSLRVVDFSLLPATCTDASFPYNAFATTTPRFDRWLLLASLLVCLYGNSVYHPRAAAVLLLSIGMQVVWLVVYGADDVAYCAWDKLTVSVADCVSPGGHSLPSQLSPCQQTAVALCTERMGMEFFVVSLFSLLLYLSVIAVICLSLYTLAGAVKQAVTQSASRRQRLEAALPPLSRPLLLTVSFPHDSFEPLWDWCERRVFFPFFSTDEQQRWMEDLQRDGAAEAVQRIAISQSLRVSFALTFAALVNTAAVVALVLACVNYWTWELSRCVLAAGLLGYLHVCLLIVVHLCSFRTHVRHRVHRLIQAEQRGELRRLLQNTKVRWWNLPFYSSARTRTARHQPLSVFPSVILTGRLPSLVPDCSGSLFGSLFWSYVLMCCLLTAIFFSLSNGAARDALWQYRLPIFRTVLYPICLILAFRYIAGFLTFHRCLFNLPTPITRRPRHPRLFLALDGVGLFVGSWGSIATIGFRLLAILLLAMGRVDVPTSAFDLPHQQFLSVVEVEAWRLWRDWKRSQSGIHVWRKDGDWELQEAEDEEREAEEQRGERGQQWGQQQQQQRQQAAAVMNVEVDHSFDASAASSGRRPARRWSSGNLAVHFRGGAWPG